MLHLMLHYKTSSKPKPRRTGVDDIFTLTSLLLSVLLRCGPSVKSVPRLLPTQNDVIVGHGVLVVDIIVLILHCSHAECLYTQKNNSSDRMRNASPYNTIFSFLFIYFKNTPHLS